MNIGNWASERGAGGSSIGNIDSGRIVWAGAVRDGATNWVTLGSNCWGAECKGGRNSGKREISESRIRIEDIWGWESI